MIINGVYPETKEVILGVGKLTLKASGDTYMQIAKRLGNEDLAVVILVPSDFVFSIATNLPEGWNEDFKGAFKNNVTMSGESEFMNPKTDAIGITGVLTTGVLGSPDGQHRADATTVTFSISHDPADNESAMDFAFLHNGKTMIDLDCTAEYPEREGGVAQFTSSRSILDVLVALMTGSNFDGSLTLNDDLTTTISISDCAKAIQLHREMAQARRNYADQATIEGYTQQLNELMSAKMTCKGVNQVIPMKMQTEKFGVDYMAMPSLNFADEQGYVPLTQLLDKESVEYAINIVDHAAEPMAGAIVTVRQLLQFVQTFLMQTRVSQAQAQAQNQ